MAHRARRVDLAGLIAAALALLLVVWQARAMQTQGRQEALPVLLWQVMVVLLAVVGAVVPRLRLRAAMYALGVVSAVLYALLSWPLGGAVDVVVAAVLAWGLVRTMVAYAAPS